MGWNGTQTYGVRVDSARVADTSNYASDSNLLDGQDGTYYDQRQYARTDNYFGGYYDGAGNSKPNSSLFGAGKLKIAMLNSTNLGFSGYWNDVLWISTYTGGDVKSSHALVFDKYSTNVWVADQDFDSGSWGTGYLLLHSGNYNSYAPTLTGGGASGTWNINISGSASSETLATVVARGNTTGGGRPITLDTGGGAIITQANGGGWAMGTYYRGSSGTYLAGFGAYGGGDTLTYAWIGSAYDSAWMTLTPSSSVLNTSLTINGVWSTNISTAGGWSKLSFTASNAWGDGTTYGVLGASGGTEPGVMVYNMHATWAGSGNGAGIRMGRSGGISSGAWYQVATMDSNEFMIAKSGQWSNGGIKITDGGVLYYGNTGYRYVWENGTWGINVTGTSGSISGFNNPTTAATPNTIVYRDAIGDITTRELVLNVGVQDFTPSSMVAIYPTTNQAVKV
jgi:hypothetical protein